MQLFPEATSSPPAACARAVLETIPLVMQTIRETIGDRRVEGLSIPQFRTLAIVHHRPQVTLSEIAEHLGLGLPSASKLIDGLVQRDLLRRSENGADRRRKVLGLTLAGRRRFAAIERRAQAALAQHLRLLPATEARHIIQAMNHLREHLAPGNGGPRPEKRP